MKQDTDIFSKENVTQNIELTWQNPTSEEEIDNNLKYVENLSKIDNKTFNSNKIYQGLQYETNSYKNSMDIENQELTKDNSSLIVEPGFDFESYLASLPKHLTPFTGRISSFFHNKKGVPRVVIGPHWPLTLGVLFLKVFFASSF